jgi:uncharacterized iron-regulated membrane protein
MSAAIDATARFRTVWRWHFYAGLFTLPFLALLSVTGALYLFKDEIEGVVYRDAVTVGARATPPLPLADIVRRVERDGLSVAQITTPPTPESALRLSVRDGDARATLWVDPWTGDITGRAEGGGVMRTVRDLHSLSITGPVGNALIELAAGWTILLIGTGVYLWWPSKTTRVRGTPGGRLFWRDLHAVTGAFGGAILMFLAVTGMPWSKVWGESVNRWVADAGLGRPPAPPGAEHMGHGRPTKPTADALPWSLRQAKMPHDHHAHDGIDADAALASAREVGLRGPVHVILPQSPGGPFMLSAKADRADDARVVYVAGSDGRILADVPASDFGLVARAFEWGIAVHEGRQYGEPNRYLMLAGSLTALLLVVTSATMWWKRRPSGSLGVPPTPPTKAGLRGLAAIMTVAGLLMPLVGASLLAALAVERLWPLLRRQQQLRAGEVH